jgi:hypothetical protein
MGTIYRSALNADEQKVYDLVNPLLEGLGSITVLKEEGGDRMRLDVVSPNHFQKTAAVLEEACAEAAKALSCSIDVNLHAHWPVGI